MNTQDMHRAGLGILYQVTHSFLKVNPPSKSKSWSWQKLLAGKMHKWFFASCAWLGAHFWADRPRSKINEITVRAILSLWQTPESNVGAIIIRPQTAHF